MAAAMQLSRLDAVQSNSRAVLTSDSVAIDRDGSEAEEDHRLD